MQLPVGDPVHLEDLFGDSVACLSRLYRVYGNCVAFQSGETPTVFAFGPEFNYPVFSDANLFHHRGIPGPKNSSQRLFKYGLFGLNGEQQVRHRRMLMPLFQKSAIDGSFHAMLALIDQTLAGWRVGQVVDLAGSMKDFSLQVTGRMLFGLKEFTSAHAVADAFQVWLDHYHTMLFAANLPVEIPPGVYERMLDAADRLVGHIKDIIKQKRRTLRPGQADVLAILLNAQDSGLLGEQEVVGEMLTMLNAAYQTTSVGLTWTLFLLAQHPQAAQAVLAEQKSVLADHPLASTHLPRLNWLNCVVKECLRLFPPVIYSQRTATDRAPFGRYTLPRNSMVVPSFYISHRMPEVFAEPEKFQPERWLDAEVSPYAYLPFSTGSRMCMGTAFATLLFKIAVSVIWQRFRLEVVPGACINRHANLTLGVEDTLPVRLHTQDGRFTCSPVTGNVLEMVELPMARGERRAA